jgi:hypothetical protein
MADQSTLETRDHDPLAAAFAQLRFEVRHELVAPGPDAARRTLRRRRTRRVALCAAAAVVALAGFVGFSALPHSRGATPANNADADAAQRAQALRAIGWPANPGVPWVYSANVAGALSYSFGTVAESYPRGTYDVNLACVGGGRITVTWYAPGDGGTDSVPCDGDARSTSLQFQTPGGLTMSVVPDAAANGHAAIAVEVTDPDAAHAVQAAGQTSYQDISAGGDVFRDSSPTALDNRADPSPLPAGRYRLIVACDGDGIVAATLSVGAASSTTDVHCSRPPGVDFVTVYTNRPTTTDEVRFDPRTVVPGTALAYRLVRVE